MSALAANVAMGAAVLLTGVAFVLMVLGLLSWSRLRHPRLLWVAVAFGLFTAKGAYLAQQAFERRADIAAEGLGGLLPTLVLLDLAVVIALYLSAWK